MVGTDGKPVYEPVTMSSREVIAEDGTRTTVTLDPPEPVLKPAYKTRYVTGNGTIVTKAEYNAAVAAGAGNVHVAAFVGVTYHCG